MEHAFDNLSKRMARNISRRDALNTLWRGALGIILASAGLPIRKPRAQGATCTSCGTCVTWDAITKTLTPCAQTCEAQTLCSKAQSVTAYQLMDSTLTNLAGYTYQATSYDGAYDVIGRTILRTSYVDNFDPNYTADLLVQWWKGGDVDVWALEYFNGTVLQGYAVNGSTVEKLSPLPMPPPFKVSPSPPTVTVVQGASATSTISAAAWSGFGKAITLKASGLPAGAKASFSPNPIAAPGTGSSTMTLKTSLTTPSGTYQVIVAGTGMKISETTTVSVTVSAHTAAVVVGNTNDMLGTQQHGFDERKSSMMVDNPEAERSPLDVNACVTSCDVAGVAAGKIAGWLCLAMAADTCGPGAPICLFLYGSAIKAACTAATGYLARELCLMACSCPACSAPAALSCAPMCNSDVCQAPNMCSADGCACLPPTCEDGVQCGELAGYCCDPGNICCGSPSTAGCCPEGWGCCGPDGGCCGDTSPVCCSAGDPPVFYCSSAACP
jgi:hypothetical protein